MEQIATTFVRWRAVILAVVISAVLVGTPAAFAANGKPFILGKINVAKATSTLEKEGSGPALRLKVNAGQPPMAVNSAAKVTNLNADQLDGVDSGAFFDETVTVVGSKSVAAGTTGDHTVQCPAGYTAVGGGVSGNVNGFDAVASVPTVGGTPISQLADGQHGPADGWNGRAQNNDPNAQIFKVTANCAR